VHEGHVSFGGWNLPVDDASRLRGYEGRTVILGIRPADLEDAAVWQGAASPTIDVRADVTEDLGSEVNVLFRVDAPAISSEELRAATSEEADDDGILLASEESRAVFCARIDARTKVQADSTLRLAVDPSRFFFFDPENGLAIGPTRTPVATA
jgi:multiple sugar transport system ATP-binding protein